VAPIAHDSGSSRSTRDDLRRLNFATHTDQYEIERSREGVTIVADASFIADLNELRHRAGNPSLGELVRLGGRKFSKASLSEHLSGQRVKLPPWRLVHAYVTACHAAAAATEISRGPLGTLDQWYQRWEYAAKGRQDAPSPFQESTKPHEELGDSLDESTEPRLRLLTEDIRKICESLSEYTGLLVVTSGPNFGYYYKIEHNITTIGRDTQCDIWLNEPTVSRRHAEIRRHRGKHFIIRDLQSKNGTYCQGKTITDIDGTALVSSDELRIGRIRLVFMQGGNGKDTLQPHQYRSVQSGLTRDSAAETLEIDLLERTCGPGSQPPTAPSRPSGICNESGALS